MYRQRDAVRTYFEDLQDVLVSVSTDDVWRMIDTLRDCYRAGTQVFIFGNGGSASTASHFACDLGKNVRVHGSRRFKVLGLTDNVPMLTAWANDTAYERVFAEQLENFVGPGDVVIGISGSGTSPNVLRAMELARARGAVTVGLTGFDGGKLAALCDVCVVVPSTNMGQIENVHLTLQHLVCELLSREIATSSSMGYGEARPERAGR
jgi:D-sedoheptulose 7-phosphate isomerase